MHIIVNAWTVSKHVILGHLPSPNISESKIMRDMPFVRHAFITRSMRRVSPVETITTRVCDSLRVLSVGLSVYSIPINRVREGQSQQLLHPEWLSLIVMTDRDLQRVIITASKSMCCFAALSSRHQAPGIAPEPCFLWLPDFNELENWIDGVVFSANTKETVTQKISRAWASIPRIVPYEYQVVLEIVPDYGKNRFTSNSQESPHSVPCCCLSLLSCKTGLMECMKCPQQSNESALKSSLLIEDDAETQDGRRNCAYHHVWSMLQGPSSHMQEQCDVISLSYWGWYDRMIHCSA